MTTLATDGILQPVAFTMQNLTHTHTHPSHVTWESMLNDYNDDDGDL